MVVFKIHGFILKTNLDGKSAFMDPARQTEQNCKLDVHKIFL